MSAENKSNYILVLIVCVIAFVSCQTIDLYEKNVAIPGHAWKSSYQPQFKFLIKDTSTFYLIYVVLRHNERYNYNNIWITLSTQIPGDKTVRKAQYELPLATNEGWIGKEAAMDDLYEHRIRITPKEGIALKAGEYIFTVQHIMREDPLENVMNVGLRIEENCQVNTMTMVNENKRKLRRTTIIYWVLLIYIIAALLWWSFSLYMQNEEMHLLQKENLAATHSTNSQYYKDSLAKIENLRRRNNAKYIGEGGAFLILILFGAVYIYRSVRRQFRLQQQQQNFVMAITHELKTPIAVSKLNLETLQRHHLDEEKKEKLVQITLQETMRLDSLINNILISSQLDGRSYRSSKEELNFSDLVNDVACQFITRYTNRKLSKDVEPDIDIHGDPLLLKLLVSNLLENANKYSPKDKPIILCLSEADGRICLQVKDEGAGISADEKKNVFQKFYRIGNEQTRTTKGTGLGLYLCKKIAEDHNGSVIIIDNQPQGSNFIVSFYK